MSNTLDSSINTAPPKLLLTFQLKMRIMLIVYVRMERGKLRDVTNSFNEALCWAEVSHKVKFLDMFARVLVLDF